MVKIYTITCHDVYNPGASLQAYALATYLKILGCQVEIIDYKPDYLSRHYSLSVIGNRRYDRPLLREIYLLLKLPGRLKALYSKRKAEFDRFKTELLPLTPRRYSSNEDLKANLPRADVYFAGSDQIWNCFFQNGRDPAFYLDFAPESAVKASYAASFATDDVPREWEPQVKKWLSRLDAVSVREDSGVQIVEKMGVHGVTQVLDPVFLLSKVKWEQMSERLLFHDKYILLYDFDRNECLAKAARKLAREKGWKVFSCLSNPFADRCFDQCGPLSFLSLVKNAELVMSNSFHATAFSVIFEKNFWVVDRKEPINARMRDLTRLLGVPERMFSDYDVELLEPVNYGTIAPIVEKQIEKSKDFINGVIRQGEIGKKDTTNYKRKQ